LFGAAPPEFVGPGAAPEIERRAGAFLPYFRVRGRFASPEDDNALAPAAPPLERYLPTLLRYADTAAWGRQARPRWGALA
jgi:long-chain acyl-CoA synthetase